LGASIATFGLAALIYGFLSSSTLGWTHFRVIASLIFGVGSLILFHICGKERKGALIYRVLVEGDSTWQTQNKSALPELDAGDDHR
jgi:hypothetical protein